MQTLETIRQLFKYNEWANTRAIESLKGSSNDNVSAIRALAHLFVAEKEWLLRLQKNKDSTGFNFWPGWSLEECEALGDETRAAYSALLSSLTEESLDSLATYKNSKGIEYSTTFRDILTHVLMHSAYHRGQVAMATRAAGDMPAYTDYIAFVRES